MNASKAQQLSVQERLDEVATLLAAGLMRLHARQSSSLPANCGESLLDCPGHQSGHAKLPDGGPQ
jgi:hypothetical protein